MQYKLKYQVTSIGRSKNCDIQVPSTITKVSREHAQIKIHKNNMYVLYDKSARGTLVNGKKEKQIVLKDGDRIILAKGVEFRFSNGRVSSSLQGIKINRTSRSVERRVPQKEHHQVQGQQNRVSSDPRAYPIPTGMNDIKDMGNLKDFVIKTFGAEVFNFQKIIPLAGSHAVSLKDEFVRLLQQRGLVPFAIFTHNDKKYFFFKKVLAKFPAKVIRTAVAIDTHGNDLFIAVRHFEFDGSRTSKERGKSSSEGWMYIIVGIFLFVGIIGIFLIIKGLKMISFPKDQKMPFEEGSTGRSDSVLILETILQSLEQALSARDIDISVQASSPF